MNAIVIIIRGEAQCDYASVHQTYASAADFLVGSITSRCCLWCTDTTVANRAARIGSSVELTRRRASMTSCSVVLLPENCSSVARNSSNSCRHRAIDYM
jgi:hypothetical protein